MRKIFPFLIFLVFLIALSCEEDYQVLPAIPKPACYPTHVSKTGGIEFTQGESYLQYDNEGRWINYTNTTGTTTLFEYEGNRVVRVQYNYGTLSAFTKYIGYNSRGQWVTMDYGYPSAGVTTAGYDQKGYLIEATSHGPGKARSVSTFTYSHGNMIKYTLNQYDEEGSKFYESQAEFTYDLTHENKLNYTQAQLRLGTDFLSDDWGPGTPSKNMLKTVTSPYFPEMITHDYEYNDQGFPIKHTISGRDYNGDGTIDENDTSVFVITYTCP